jgi:glycosyltransferase involved in cell wall biosynthesis
MVSVIIPCYNYGHLVADTIDSILQQTYTDLEIIVIDDGSKDNTEDAVKACMAKDKRVVYYKYSNTGLGASRNRGLEKAKGDFIQFLDADDLIEKRKFEVQLKLFAENSHADVVYGSVRYFSKDPYDPADRLLTYWGPNEEWMPKLTGKGSDLLPKVLTGNFSHLSSPLFRKKIVDKVGLFDNEISAVADYHFLLRTAVADAFFYYHDTPETYSLVRWHPDNMSKNLNRMWSEELKMRQKLAPLLVHNPQAVINNENAMKSFQLKLGKSWKQTFLSGGKFDFIKKILRFLGLERLAKRIFYK